MNGLCFAIQEPNAAAQENIYILHGMGVLRLNGCNDWVF